MTDQQFSEWLRSGSARRTVLIEVDTDDPKRVASHAYTVPPGGAGANTAYRGLATDSVAFTESLAVGLAGSSAGSQGFGDISLHNENRALDPWFAEVFRNRALRVYWGDTAWPREDFRLVFSGVVDDVSSRDRNRLNIVLRNKLDRLNAPVSEQLLGGTSPNADRLRPNVFGEVHNVSPLLTSSAQLEYMAHDGQTERIIEVRDDGAPVTITQSLSAGTFKLAARPKGTITASVQGRAQGGYTNTIAGIVQALATTYGTPQERFTLADIDTTQLAQFTAANPQPVGVAVSDRENVLSLCQELAASVGAQVMVTSAGLLRILQITAGGYGTPVPITASNYDRNGVSIRARTTVVSGVKIAYCKNWTVQTTVAEGIPAQHADLFKQEWLVRVARDTAVADKYRLYAEPEQTETLLLRGVDAQAEADRRLALWKVPHTVYACRCGPEMMNLQLGQAVTLFSDAFGLQGGKTGPVVELRRDWITGVVDVGVMI